MSVCTYGYISCGVRLWYGLQSGPQLSLLDLWFPDVKPKRQYVIVCDETGKPKEHAYPCAYQGENNPSRMPAYHLAGVHYPYQPAADDEYVSRLVGATRRAAFCVFSDADKNGWGTALAAYLRKHFPKSALIESEMANNPNSSNAIRVWTWTTPEIGMFEAHIKSKAYMEAVTPYFLSLSLGYPSRVYFTQLPWYTGVRETAPVKPVVPANTPAAVAA